MEGFEAMSLRGSNHKVHLDEVPRECPICHHSISPRRAAAVHTSEAPRAGRAHVLYQCSNARCASGFIAVHEYAAHEKTNDYYGLKRVWPRTAKPLDVPESVTSVSPDFVRIQEQALEAEAHELDQVVGIALRKALEFLIKDFVIHCKPADADKVRKTLLGQVIKDFVDDPNIKACAARAAWLGNDEAHYVRRWEDKDVSDLKKLIRLSVNWVDSVLLTEEYTRDMPASST